MLYLLNITKEKEDPHTFLSAISTSVSLFSNFLISPLKHSFSTKKQQIPAIGHLQLWSETLAL